jgi:hypothetical protein
MGYIKRQIFCIFRLGFQLPTRNLMENLTLCDLGMATSHLYFSQISFQLLNLRFSQRFDIHTQLYYWRHAGMRKLLVCQLTFITSYMFLLALYSCMLENNALTRVYIFIWYTLKTFAFRRFSFSIQDHRTHNVCLNKMLFRILSQARFMSINLKS